MKRITLPGGPKGVSQSLQRGSEGSDLLNLRIHGFQHTWPRLSPSSTCLHSSSCDRSSLRLGATACPRIGPPMISPVPRKDGADSVARVVERVLTVRELNRATLARQLLLQRTRLSPAAVIERLVGMQAQWPPAPYVGIWTRTTSFRRASLERELTRGTVVKATVMRQTLHFVTPRDYGLIRAAMSETNFPWESSQAKELKSSVRALGARGPVTNAEGIEHLRQHHGISANAKRVWQYARIHAHRLHHHETALWHARPEARFVALEEPDAHDPTAARAELFRRYLAAFGPASRRDMVKWSMMHVPEIQRAIDRLE